MGYTLKKDRMYMMPTHFGPYLGPRQNKQGKRYIYDDPGKTTFNTIIFESTMAQLEDLMPPNFTVIDPYVTILHGMNRNVPWLAGKGYNILGVTVPAQFKGKKDTIRGSLLLVLWENHADPIITGREQLGYSKIYAEIEDIQEDGAISYTQAKSWDFSFLEMKIDYSKPPENQAKIGELLKNSTGFLHYKYIPKTGGHFNETDADYATYSPNNWDIPRDINPANIVRSELEFGQGEIKFNTPTWEQMPTQSHIVNRLANLEIKGYLGAFKYTSVSPNDLYSQRILQ